MSTSSVPARFLSAFTFVTLLIFGCISDISRTANGSCIDLTYGTPVRVSIKEGEIITGTYLQMENMPFLEYLDHYRVVREGCSDCDKLPVPGEPIYFSTRLVPNEFRAGTMVGFCSQYLWVRLRGESEISHYYLNCVTRLFKSDGQVVFHGDLTRLMAANELPLMTRLALQRDEQTFYVPLDNIQHIEAIQDGSYKDLDIYAMNRDMSLPENSD